MGRGNVTVGRNDRLYYVDYDYFNRFTNKVNPEHEITPEEYYSLPSDEQTEFDYDEITSQLNYDNFKQELVLRLTGRYKSLQPDDSWSGRYRHIICSNKLFVIALEDNEWSVAVEILAKTDGPIGLQRHQINGFARNLRDILLDMFPTINVRTSAWTSETITKEDARTMDRNENKRKRELRKIRKETVASLESILEKTDAAAFPPDKQILTPKERTAANNPKANDSIMDTDIKPYKMTNIHERGESDADSGSRE